MTTTTTPDRRSALLAELAAAGPKQTPRTHAIRDELRDTSSVELRRARALLDTYNGRDPATDAIVATAKANLETAIYSHVTDEDALFAVFTARQALRGVQVHLGGILGGPNEPDADAPVARVLASWKIANGR